MSISARNQLNVELTQVKTGAVNSLITGKLSGGEILKATVTIDSQNALKLKEGKKALFLFKASNVIIAKDSTLRLSATNQIQGTISSIENGAVNSEVIIDIKGDKISAIITKQSVKNLSLKVGDNVKAVIKATQIIVGVRD